MAIRMLGIETSCDETAVAIVRDGRVIESNVIASQTDLHERYGGVVPEQASRAHVRAIVPALLQARAQATVDWDDIDAIAVTHGPGLAGALLVGVNAAKGLAFARSKPLLGINHLEGHLYANWLEAAANQSEPAFPILAVIVSGGHSDIVLATDHGQFQRLGRTRDDAAGEAFDKVARLLGLPFPGGPPIEQAALEGDPERFPFPRAWLEPDSWDFSFSGLKTAVLHEVRAQGESLPVADLAASFQAAVVDVLATKAVRAARAFGARQIALGGGVAANRSLRARLEGLADVPVLCPPPRLCTDNGAMVAVAGYYRYQAGQRDGLDLDVLPGLPIA
jgi:N6-L-threonylcarbamoyladenine synthase